MPSIELRRTKYTTTYTLGELRVLEKGVQLFRCFTLELAWKQNKPKVSCVPAGTYELVLEMSPAFGRELWELKGVPDRSECKIHAANYTSELLGCIAPGMSITDINSDGIMDATSSKVALEGIHKAMGSARKSTITIR